MPEPVVIIGPAAGPAGPNSGRHGAPANPEAGETTGAAPETEATAAAAASKKKGAAAGALLRIVGLAVSLLRRVIGAALSVLVAVARRYPRHSIAALASVLILGGIVYSQSRFGTTRRDVTNAISANQTQGDAEAKEPKSEGGTKVAGDSKAGEGAAKEGGSATDPAAPTKGDTTDVTVAQTEAGASSSGAPPKPQSTDKPQPTEHDAAPPGSLAQNEVQKKDETKPEAAPVPAAAQPAISSAEPAVVPLPAPTGETAKAATLLSSAAGQEHGNTPPVPAPAAANEKKNADSSAIGPAPTDQMAASQPPAAPPPGAGEQVAKTNPMPEPPADLWLPDGANKAADEKPKDSVKGEPAPATEGPAPAPATAPVGKAAFPSGESKPREEPRKIEALVLPPIESAAKPSVEPTPASSGGPPESPAVAIPQKPDEPKPLAAPAIAAPTPVQVGPTVPERTEPAPGGEKVAMPQGEPTESKPVEQTPRTGSDPGWIPIPNSGSLPVDPAEKAAEPPDAGGLERGSRPATDAADSRFHARRSVEFEPEPSQSQREGGATNSSSRHSGSAAAAAAEQQPRAASHMERVEATEHVVERGENYWIISRQYWGSGRYFAALWKANSANHPYIDVLREGDVIVVPAIEELNPDYILAPARTASPQWEASLGITRRAGRGPRTGGGDTEAAVAPAPVRTRPASVRGDVPARRASRSEYEDDSAPSVTASGGDRSTAYKGRSAAAAKVFDGDEAGDDQDVRTTARPRGSAAGGSRRPVYRVRTYDTLRSIARDMLGDSRRANEILELNRGVIDDPGQLVVGQVIELPEDARGGIRRSASNR